MLDLSQPHPPWIDNVEKNIKQLDNSMENRNEKHNP